MCSWLILSRVPEIVCSTRTTLLLGDAWFHMITVEQIKRVGGECDELPLLGQARPSRAAKVIDGANARIPLASKAWVPTPTK